MVATSNNGRSPQPAGQLAPPSSSPAAVSANSSIPPSSSLSPPKVSALVKQAASIPSKKTTAQAQARGQGRAKGTGADGHPGRKRGRIGDAAGKGIVDGDDAGGGDAPRPFAPLPFYGDHKRAVSSLSFAPPSSPVSRGSGGAASHNSNLGQVTSALCASASADGCAKVWDITKNLTDAQHSNGNSDTSKKKKGAQGVPAVGSPPPAFVEAASKLEPRLSLFGHNRGINDVAWSPTASYVATASDDRTLRLWSAETGDALVEFRGHTNFVFSCGFSPQSNLLVSGSFDETVKLWDVRCGECVATLPAHSNPVTGVDFNRDGTCIVSGSYDGLVRIWDTATGECLKTVYAEGNPPVGCVRFSPNGRFVLCGTLDSKLRLYDVFGGGRGRGAFDDKHHRLQAGWPQPRGGKCSKTYMGHTSGKFCTLAAFLPANPDRQCVVSGSEDGKVYLYDLQSRLVRQALEGHRDAVLAVDAHGSLELVGSGGMASDKLVRFWGPSEVEMS